MSRFLSCMLLVAAIGVVIGFPVSSGPPVSARRSGDAGLNLGPKGCDVTPYVEAGLESTFSTTWFGGGDFWAGLYSGENGVWFAAPEFAKVHWTRPAGQTLTIEGRRLDAASPPLDARIPDGYDRQGFQVTILTFPDAGCWEITGHIPGHDLRFVVYVHPGDEFHNIEPAPSTTWETLERSLVLTPTTAAAGCPRTSVRAIARVEGSVLGDGPVYVQGLGDDGGARIDPDLEPDVPASIPLRWIIDPTYEGPLLIRGQRIDGSESLHFGPDDPYPATQIWPEHRLSTPDWRVHGGYLRLPGAGCYVLQIDGTDFTQRIVFEAVIGVGADDEPPRSEPLG